MKDENNLLALQDAAVATNGVLPKVVAQKIDDTERLNCVKSTAMT